MAARAIKPIGHACLACAGCLVIAACSSSSKPAASSPYGPASSPFALSKCMRANGVSNFPDPSAGPGGEGFNGIGVGVNGTLVVDGTTIAGPAAAAAEKACKEYLPPGGPPPRMSAAQKARLLAFARCMRANGVPNFPDPSFGSAAPKKIVGGPNGIDPQAPAFRHAVASCGGKGTQIAVSLP
ncbi:MAG: hypothetical protein ACLPV4_05080 [Solirubrobacteraceae bacterium]